MPNQYTKAKDLAKNKKTKKVKATIAKVKNKKALAKGKAKAAGAR